MIRVLDLDLVGAFLSGIGRELSSLSYTVVFRSSLADVQVDMAALKSVCGACL